MSVLDLGCGEWLLLEKILQLHVDGHLQATCSYVGIDFPHGRQDRWSDLSTRCETCFPTVEDLHFDLLQDEGLVEALQRRKPFDLIVLANVLHELPPQRGLRLFELLFPHLTENGKIIIIDPDFDWCFSREAWTRKSEWNLEDIPVEWEADAVWLSRQAISEVLRAMGFQATVHPYPRLNMVLWAAQGGRRSGADATRTADGRNALKGHLAVQVSDERKRIARLRRELCEQFRKSSGLSGELLVKTIEFFAACASQCRRLEAMEELGP